MDKFIIKTNFLKDKPVEIVESSQNFNISSSIKFNKELKGLECKLEMNESQKTKVLKANFGSKLKKNQFIESEVSTNFIGKSQKSEYPKTFSARMNKLNFSKKRIAVMSIQDVKDILGDSDLSNLVYDINSVKNSLCKRSSISKVL